MTDAEKALVKQPTRGADIMEGAGRARNNRDYAAAANNLKNSFNPKVVKELDTAAYEFCDHHVFKAVKVLDREGKETNEKTGEISIIYYAGEHVSNVDLALIAKLEEDTETQKTGNDNLEKAGYITKAEEPDTDAQVLS